MTDLICKQCQYQAESECDLEVHFDLFHEDTYGTADTTGTADTNGTGALENGTDSGSQITEDVDIGESLLDASMDDLLETSLQLLEVLDSTDGLESSLSGSESTIELTHGTSAEKKSPAKIDKDPQTVQKSAAEQTSDSSYADADEDLPIATSFRKKTASGGPRRASTEVRDRKRKSNSFPETENCSKKSRVNVSKQTKDTDDKAKQSKSNNAGFEQLLDKYTKLKMDTSDRIFRLEEINQDLKAKLTLCKSEKAEMSRKSKDAKWVKKVERLQKELEEAKAKASKNNNDSPFDKIKKCVMTIIKRDSEMSQSDTGSAEALKDSEVVELVNSIMLEFSDSKKQLLTATKVFKDEMESAKAERDTSKAKAEKLAQDLLEAQASSKATEFEKNKKIATMQKESLAKDSRIKELEKLAAKSLAKESYGPKIKDLEAKLEEKNKVIKELRRDMEEIVTEGSKVSSTQAKQLEKQIRYMDKSLKEQIAKNEQLESKKDQELAQLKENLSVKVSKLEGELKEKEEAFKELESRCDTTKKDLEEKTGDLDGTKATMDELVKCIKQLREKEGEQFSQTLADLKVQLKQKDDLLEIMQWSFYILDKKIQVKREQDEA